MVRVGGKMPEMPQDDDEQQALRRLNEDFYSADPSDYITTRLRFLLLATAEDSRLAELLDGIEYEGLAAVHPTDDEQGEGDPESAQAEKRARLNYLAIESEQLLHHAAETLLRLYLAHRDWPSA